MAQQSRITLTYPVELSIWGREIVEDTPFRSYLRKAHDSATVGDQWKEFVGVGCCGDEMDVVLQVESIEGDSAITSNTEFTFTERDACHTGGWEVQSKTGPTT